MTYLIIKNIHIICVILSISFFILRGYWMLIDSSLLQIKPVRVLPHIIDTLLLVSAVWLTLIIQQYPFVDAWLTAKVIALIFYIIFGSIAIKYGRTKKLRIAAFVAALLTVIYIIIVAHYHQVLPNVV